ncbi:cd81 antigen, partial [Desmophyllum pertusum]
MGRAFLYGGLQEHHLQTGFTSATAILMGVGSVIGIIGFAGCYGAIRENHFTLKLFSYLLVLLLIAEIALGLWLYFAHFSLSKFFRISSITYSDKYQEDKDVNGTSLT